MIPVDDPQYLSLLFHLNSEPWLNEDAYRSAGYQHEFKQTPRNPTPHCLAGAARAALRN